MNTGTREFHQICIFCRTSRYNIRHLLADIMVAGICWQMFTMAVFVGLVIIFAHNVAREHVQIPRSLGTFCWGMALVTLMIFIRCIYRTAELMEGWTGYIITHEVYFICLEFVPMVIALVAFNVWHPGMYLLDENKLLGSTGDQQRKEAVDDVEVGKIDLKVYSTKNQLSAEAVVVRAAVDDASVTLKKHASPQKESSTEVAASTELPGSVPAGTCGC